MSRVGIWTFGTGSSGAGEGLSNAVGFDRDFERAAQSRHTAERDFFADNLIHSVIVMIRWTDLALLGFGIPFSR